jgi:hypothetical protein
MIFFILIKKFILFIFKLLHLTEKKKSFEKDEEKKKSF